jgi:hypothetical protein
VLQPKTSPFEQRKMVNRLDIKQAALMRQSNEHVSHFDVATSAA